MINNKLRACIVTLALIISMTSEVAAVKRTTGACELKILEQTAYGWHDLFEGFIYAVADDPPQGTTECDFCDFIGN